MLTNSIILFLRDLLPVFIMLAYLQALFISPPQQLRFTVVLSSFVIFFSTVVLIFYENISEISEGNGLEWFKIVSLLIGLALIWVAILNNKVSQYQAFTLPILIIIGAVLISSTHLSSLLLFLNIYFSNQQSVLELSIGCAIGFGISLSFYFIFAFVLHELVSMQAKGLVYALFALFMAGQVGIVANLLQQIDLLTVGVTALFDVTDWINESTEYGYLLKALFGFEASPTAAYLTLLSSTFTLTFIILMRQKRYDTAGAYNE
ncbi:hypothetical protein [Paraglaciecola marina]|uniref:hypothetical protein n=1 Tax=Paraglaciecola marina TaxID=2500157 RepID=UPI00105D0E27|nr:hypothetical protein [Paraglaciecola marina]